MLAIDKLELKEKFVKLRADGKTYSDIANTLSINTKTCQRWNNELLEQIEKLKSIKKQELAEQYILCKKKRLQVLASVLDNLQDAALQIDYNSIKPYRLIVLLLKYTELAKSECVPEARKFSVDADAGQEAFAVLADLLARMQAGDITPEQAAQENSILGNILKAYDSQVLKNRLDDLEKELEAWKQ